MLDGTRTHHLRARYSQVSFPDQDEVGDLTLEVWIGVEDDLWRQAQTEVEAESTEGTVTSVLEFSAYGEAAAIEHPDSWWTMIRDVRLTPSEPVPAQPFTVAFAVDNHGGVQLNTTIDVVLDGETIRTLPVTDLAPGASQEIEFMLTLEAGFNNLLVGGIRIAVFEESDRRTILRSFPLLLSSYSVLPGQPVTISVILEAGDEVDISISGQIIRTFINSEMPGGTSQTFTLELFRSEPGQYQVEVNWQSGYFGTLFAVTGSPPEGYRLSVHQGAESLAGEELLFSDVLALGKPVVVNFWAGLCPPCRAEMPSLQQVYEENKEEFILLGIDVGPFTGLGTNEDGIRLLEQLGITYPTASVPDDQLVRDYRVMAMPTTLFITEDGIIQRRWAGPLNETTMEELVLELISLSDASTVGEPTPTPSATPVPTPTSYAEPTRPASPTATAYAEAVPDSPMPTATPTVTP